MMIYFLNFDLIIHIGAENPCGLWWRWLSAADLHQEHARSPNSLPWGHSEAQSQCMWDSQWSVCVKFNNAMHIYQVCVQVKNAQFFVVLGWADVPYFIGLWPFIVEVPVIHLSS